MTWIDKKLNILLLPLTIPYFLRIWRWYLWLSCNPFSCHFESMRYFCHMISSAAFSEILQFLNNQRIAAWFLHLFSSNWIICLFRFEIKLPSRIPEAEMFQAWNILKYFILHENNACVWGFKSFCWVLSLKWMKY